MIRIQLRQDLVIQRVIVLELIANHVPVDGAQLLRVGGIAGQPLAPYHQQVVVVERVGGALQPAVGFRQRKRLLGIFLEHLVEMLPQRNSLVHREGERCPHPRRSQEIDRRHPRLTKAGLHQARGIILIQGGEVPPR